MTKKICFLLFVLFSLQGYAQTGIGTSTPHASAKLDVTSTNKGFLPPRVTLTAATDAVTIPSPAEGLLVYNLGSVGLQAGYYYWNGASWSTIATGTTAGNAVIASDLVKLYAEAWSNASNKIGNTNGYSFTIPVSGRYAFDFSSTTYGSTSFTINFYVRQGTTNLASDGQVSTNNGVRVEYNGKFEVNLQAGTTYNVYVTSTNINRGSEDYDRVYYKMVAGNLPVNQHMAERNIQLNNNYLSNDGGNEGIRIDNSGNVGIGTSSPNASAILDISSTTKGITFPRMTSTQRNAISSPTNGLQVFDITTNSIWYFDGSSWINSVSVASFGDIKTGIQVGDHNGWIRLDGRALSTLSTTQRSQAAALGITSNLPNATNAFLVQNETTLGSLSKSNTKTISKANLPLYDLTGNTNAEGAHTHTGTVPGVYTVSGTSSGGSFPGGTDFSFRTGNLTINSSGSHSHPITISSGGSGTELDITPRSLSVNTFIYLGN